VGSDLGGEDLRAGRRRHADPLVEVRVRAPLHHHKVVSAQGSHAVWQRSWHMSRCACLPLLEVMSGAQAATLPSSCSCAHVYTTAMHHNQLAMIFYLKLNG